MNKSLRIVSRYFSNFVAPVKLADQIPGKITGAFETVLILQLRLLSPVVKMSVIPKNVSLIPLYK